MNTVPNFTAADLLFKHEGHRLRCGVKFTGFKLSASHSIAVGNWLWRGIITFASGSVAHSWWQVPLPLDLEDFQKDKKVEELLHRGIAAVERIMDSPPWLRVRGNRVRRVQKVEWLPYEPIPNLQEVFKMYQWSMPKRRHYWAQWRWLNKQESVA